MELAPDKGLIFYSAKSKSGKPSTPKRQLMHLREDTGINNLTMHYFRHIYASVSAQSGINIASIAASLGHTNTNTAQEFYITTDNVESSREVNKHLIDHILTE